MTTGKRHRTNGSDRLIQNVRPRFSWSDKSTMGEFWDFRSSSCPWRLLPRQVQTVSDCFLGWVWVGQSIQIRFLLRHLSYIVYGACRCWVWASVRFHHYVVTSNNPVSGEHSILSFALLCFFAELLVRCLSARVGPRTNNEQHSSALFDKRHFAY